LRHEGGGRRKGGGGRRERVLTLKEDNEGGDRSSSVKSWKAAEVAYAVAGRGRGRGRGRALCYYVGEEERGERYYYSLHVCCVDR